MEGSLNWSSIQRELEEASKRGKRKERWVEKPLLSKSKFASTRQFMRHVQEGHMAQIPPYSICSGQEEKSARKSRLEPSRLQSVMSSQAAGSC